MYFNMLAKITGQRLSENGTGCPVVVQTVAKLRMAANEPDMAAATATLNDENGLELWPLVYSKRAGEKRAD